MASGAGEDVAGTVTVLRRNKKQAAAVKRYVLYRAEDSTFKCKLAVRESWHQVRDYYLKDPTLDPPDWLQIGSPDPPQLPILATNEEPPTVWYGIAAEDMCRLLDMLA